MDLDWDKLRIFHAAADAGSFTHAGETLGLSQSAVSRQVSALEQELRTPLFHRHARGLILTEQGEMLYRTAHQVHMQLESVTTRLSDSRDRPHGDLKITTTPGLGISWLTPRIKEFMELYPEINIQIIVKDEELDLSMREADVAIRLRQPVQPDLIQRRLFTVHFHAYASASYLKEHGAPTDIRELDNHKILSFGTPAPSYLRDVNWLLTVGRDEGEPRRSGLRINSIHALKRAVQAGAGIAVLPDYLIDASSGLVRIQLPEDLPSFDSYLVYAGEMKETARLRVFRDFIVAKAKSWAF
ncbi:MAG: LysR family transcriptional regulator [Rhodobiaceae bacterium]|nr:LysR family transcriptional regulator [Rhodobiaceae bacterium]MCC0056302.1 LysR family transcriptional regulator [Rhodobiaceae bacterium]